jgi:hypothetical protein
MPIGTSYYHRVEDRIYGNIYSLEVRVTKQRNPPGNVPFNQKLRFHDVT